MNILITTAEWKSALACMQSFSKQGHNVSMISVSPYTPALYSKFCAERIISPKETDKDEYLHFVLKIIKNGKYDILVPISDLCIEYFSEIEKELLKYIKIVLPSRELVLIARDKYKTYCFAKENNIPVPETHRPDNPSYLERIANNIKYPCVIKMVNSTGGSGNSYPTSKSNLITAVNTLMKMGYKPIIQEFVKGTLYGFTAICNNGKIDTYFMFKVPRQYPSSGGVAVYASSIQDDELLSISEKVVNGLKWSGPIDLDFIFLKDRGFLLLEINPRLSGTAQFAYSCGVDLPLRYLELISGEKRKRSRPRYKAGELYRSVFTQEIKSCMKERKKESIY